jgi:hypothetical protein
MSRRIPAELKNILVTLVLNPTPKNSSSFEFISKLFYPFSFLIPCIPFRSIAYVKDKLLHLPPLFKSEHITYRPPDGDGSPLTF